ncbi:MAG: hypothetical protein VE96_C0008G0013 [candidate division Kazan bacterium GW2011_GWA1_44_22]|uniref:Antitoxin n=1 Tax=candidate division Kazan bacterium GW2011_GWA1_44_22 TaxID=1620410 RepID=A0A0G1K938_UNCK3|nr:MAG: hypothetical protein VE96_C0008G0013 [candidate division Kazan bacterium GW2011_GWA1_44_22]
MNNIVGFKEFRENSEHYIKQIKKGKSFTVVRRSMPIFKASSPDEDDSMWETVIDFTKIRKGGVPAKEILKYL